MFYGNGPYVDELISVCEQDPRIEYRGLAENEVIVAEEKKASLLVNPRPTDQDFVKYSFPSKNLEYMLSGTPLLTTDLPGMPIEYHQYVYLFDKQSVDGYAESIKKVMSIPKERLKEKGLEARNFVLREKNKAIQTARIKSFIKGII